jgi:acetylornithine/succinyldiaminopimelate/putrescine aminotransferase
MKKIAFKTLEMAPTSDTVSLLISSNHVKKPNLLGLEQAKSLNAAQVAALHVNHINPGQLYFLKLLGFDDVVIDHAEGLYYYDKKGRKILDFFGGFGSLAFGHNHPRLVEARRRYEEERRHHIAIAFMSQYATVMARNLAEIAPGDLDMVFFASSGAEAVEYAMKLAERHQGPDRFKIAYAEKSFHGKTRGALSVTDSPLYQASFRLLDAAVKIPFGDAEALERALCSDRSIGTVILETVQGGAGVITAPVGYWKDVRRICDRHGVLWIADEVQCGYGRTGRFFAFEHENVVPDIVTLAKSLGGGIAAMGCAITRRPVFMKAYGTNKTGLIHAPATFGGMGETAATAIEALNILYDDGLIDNAAEQGAHLIARLRALQAKYPKIIKEIRGQGLMVGIEFADISQTLPLAIRQMVSMFDDKLKGSVAGCLGAILLRDYQMLVAFTEYNRNVIRLEPALIVTRAEVNRFVDAMDDLLGRGITRIVTDYLR